MTHGSSVETKMASSASSGSAGGWPFWLPAFSNATISAWAFLRPRRVDPVMPPRHNSQLRPPGPAPGRSRWALPLPPCRARLPPTPPASAISCWASVNEISDKFAASLSEAVVPGNGDKTQGGMRLHSSLLDCCQPPQRMLLHTRGCFGLRFGRSGVILFLFLFSVQRGGSQVHRAAPDSGAAPHCRGTPHCCGTPDGGAGGQGAEVGTPNRCGTPDSGAAPHCCGTPDGCGTPDCRAAPHSGEPQTAVLPPTEVLAM